MPNFTLPHPHIPDDILATEKTFQRVLKSLVLASVRAGRTPEPIPPVVKGRQSVSFAPAEVAEIRAAFGRDPDGPTLGGYVFAEIHARSKEKKPAKAVQANHEFRQHQKIYYDNLITSLRAGRIAVAEGATGLGKSRAMVQAALDMIEETKEKVVIACPSVGVMQQMLGEFFQLDPQGCRVAIALGRPNFIDPQSVKDSLSEMDKETAEKIQNWLDRGAPAIVRDDGSPLTRLHPDIAYLLDDLARLLPDDMTTAGFDLGGSPEEGCPAEAEYQRLRAGLHEADLVICSHAMLAVDLRQRRMAPEAPAMLPDYAYLIVDEAHLLEANVAGIESVSFSPFTLRTLARGAEKIGNKKTREHVANICSTIIAQGRVFNGGASVAPHQWNLPGYQPPPVIDHYMREMSRLKEALNELLKSRKTNGNATASTLSGIRTTLGRIISKKWAVRINISPVRKYPTFAAGPYNVDYVFKQLWEQPFLKGAAIASATLVLPGGIGASHIMKQLAIPSSRADIHVPVIPSWVTRPVTLYVPKDPTSWLPPQEGEFGEDEERLDQAIEAWSERMASLVREVGATAQKGTLVLTTSYEAIEMLEKKLEGLENRLVVQRAGIPFAHARQRFLDLVEAGERPVWLATGQAWTGLDLRDNLSDLIVTRLPFPGRGSRVSAGRGASKFDTAFTFRQGIGRLVRQEGASPKRLWIADGRVWAKSGGKSAFYSVFREVLSVYEAKRDF